MRFLLDTNVISELRKEARADVGVIAWFEQVDEGALFLSVLVLGEMHRGVELVRRRDPAGAAALDRWIRSIEQSFASRILPITETIARTWGHLNVPDPLPTTDSLIAATAYEHEMTIVTRNERDFARTGAPLVNPFAERTATR